MKFFTNLALTMMFCTLSAGAAPDPTRLSIPSAGVDIHLDSLNEITLDQNNVTIKRVGAADMRLPYLYVTSIVFTGGSSALIHRGALPEIISGARILHNAKGITMQLNLKRAGMYQVMIYDYLGRLVGNSAVAPLDAGIQSKPLALHNTGGADLANGSYTVVGTMDGARIFSAPLMVTGGVK